LVISLIFATINGAPPQLQNRIRRKLIYDKIEKRYKMSPIEETNINEINLVEEETDMATTMTPIEQPIDIISDLSSDNQKKFLSGSERFALIGHLGQLKRNKLVNLSLNSQKQLAVQEIKLQDLGLDPFSDHPLYTKEASSRKENPHLDESDISSGDEESKENSEVTTILPETTSALADPLPKAATIEPVVERLLSGKERQALLSPLGEVDLRRVDKLILTPVQQLAITQELELLDLGLAPFSDPTTWERLGREKQVAFNEKYLALEPSLQEFSREQFLSASPNTLSHALNMFISLPMDTLTQILKEEAFIIHNRKNIKIYSQPARSLSC